jgi:hypothetical protein
MYIYTYMYMYINYIINYNIQQNVDNMKNIVIFPRKLNITIY